VATLPKTEAQSKHNKTKWSIFREGDIKRHREKDREKDRERGRQSEREREKEIYNPCQSDFSPQGQI